MNARIGILNVEVFVEVDLKHRCYYNKNKKTFVEKSYISETRIGQIIRKSQRWSSRN